MMRTRKAAVLVTLGIGLTLAAAQPLAQSGGENALGRRIEGTWSVQITPRDCVSGVEFPNFRVPGLATILSGGAVISSGPPPALLSTGHGVWSHTGGQSFRNSIRSFLFAPTGAVVGVVTVTREIVLSPDGASFTADDIAEGRALNGTLLETRCAGIVGTRVE